MPANGLSGFVSVTVRVDLMAYLDFFQLLAQGRPDDYPVAYEGARLVDWKTFRSRSRCFHQRDGGQRRRVILADPSPVDFLARLVAVLEAGDVPLIPPNFQPETLETLAGLPPPGDMPPLTLELFSSGSTGEPKCIPKSLRQLDAECHVLERCWGKAADGAGVVATTPHHHIYGLLFRLLWPLSAGRPFDSATCTDMGSLGERLHFVKDAVLISSPAQLSRIPELLDLSAFSQRPRLVFSSGGPLSMDTALKYAEAWGAAPVEIFGSTETGGIAWRQQSGAGGGWKPLPEVRVSADADGALLVHSPFLPDARALRIEDGVAFSTDGSFQLNGRLDRIVKIEEKRLSLPEMETWLASHALVSAAAVAPVGIGRRTMVGAVVVTRPDAPQSRREIVAELKRHLSRKFDDVLLPRRWRFVEALPYNERGKLQARDLVALLSTPL